MYTNLFHVEYIVTIIRVKNSIAFVLLLEKNVDCAAAENAPQRFVKRYENRFLSFSDMYAWPCQRRPIRDEKVHVSTDSE